MKREELAPILQKNYTEGSPCGVAKVQDPGLENVWFVVPPAPPTTLPKSLPAQSLARALRLLEQLPHPDEADELDHLSTYLFVRREAISSSRIEGTWSTIDHVFTPGELYDQKSDRSERAAVLGYAHALEKEFQSALKKGAKVFNKALVCRLHKTVMEKDPAFRGIPGKLRKTPVFIGGLSRKEESLYNPTPPQYVNQCLSGVLSWMSNVELVELGNAGMGLPLPVRMAIGHSHFEAVHPFSDGNGRVGRMLLTLQMVAHKILPLYLSGFIEAEKKSYVHVLQQSQKKLNYAPIVEFFCEAIVASYEEAQQTKEAIRKLPDEWNSRAQFRGGSAAQRALQLLLSNPIVTTKQLQTQLKVTKPAANNAIQQLLAAKIVRERTGHKRYRIFAAEEVLELLARGFSEPPSVALSKAMELLNQH